MTILGHDFDSKPDILNVPGFINYIKKRFDNGWTNILVTIMTECNVPVCCDDQHASTERSRYHCG